MRLFYAALTAAALAAPLALPAAAHAADRGRDRGGHDRRFDEHAWRDREWHDHHTYYPPPGVYGSPYPVAPLFGITIR